MLQRGKFLIFIFSLSIKEVFLICYILVFEPPHLTRLQECTGSICLAYGMESCQCDQGPNDKKTKACELCCKLPGEGEECRYIEQNYLVL